MQAPPGNARSELSCVEAMFGQKERERRTLVGLAAGLIHNCPESRQKWIESLQRHEEMKNDSLYLAGFDGDAREMELQVSLMKEILQMAGYE